MSNTPPDLKAWLKYIHKRTGELMLLCERHVDIDKNKGTRLDIVACDFGRAAAFVHFVGQSLTTMCADICDVEMTDVQHEFLIQEVTTACEAEFDSAEEKYKKTMGNSMIGATVVKADDLGPSVKKTNGGLN